MNVSITAELKKYIDEKVESGYYQSSSEVIREALRLMYQRDVLFKKRLTNLNNDIEIGLKQLEQGQSINTSELQSHISKRSNNFLNDQNG